MTLTIEIWIWPLDTGNDLSDLLATSEQDRARSFVRTEDARRYIAGRGGLRRILAGYTGLSPDRLSLVTTGRNKPVLTDGPAFNLSHAGGYAALAVAPGRTEAEAPLGIDIEQHRDIDPRVADISFSDTERAALALLSGQDWTEAFFRCWTRKEAVIKAAARGLYMDLGSFDVTMTRDAPAELTRIGREFPQPDHWRMADFELTPTLPGALACITGGQGVNIILRDAPECVRPVFRF